MLITGGVNVGLKGEKTLNPRSGVQPGLRFFYNGFTPIVINIKALIRLNSMTLP